MAAGADRLAASGTGWVAGVRAAETSARERCGPPSASCAAESRSSVDPAADELAAPLTSSPRLWTKLAARERTACTGAGLDRRS